MTQECSCHPVDVAQLGVVSALRWRELSVEKKVCAILGCTCPPARKCKGTNCGVTYCAHHSSLHQASVFHAVTWEHIEAVAP